MSLLTLMHMTAAFFEREGDFRWAPYILVSKLKKIKTKFLYCTGYLNSIKTYKARFTANSSSCTTTELSKVLTSCLTAVKNMLSSTVKRYMRDPVKTYFGLLKIQVKF